MWSRPNVVIQLNFQSEICTYTIAIRVVEFSNGDTKLERFLSMYKKKEKKIVLKKIKLRLLNVVVFEIFKDS